MRHAVLLCLAAGLCACRAPSPTPTDAQAVRRTIDSLDAKADGWYAAGNADSVASLFAADGRQFPPNQNAVVGRDSIRAYWQTGFSFGKWDFSLKSDDVVAVDSIAVERGSYTLHFAANAQSPIPSFDDHGHYLVLWRREGGKWRAVWDAPVSDVPLPAPPPKK